MQEHRWRILGRALRKRCRHGRASVFPGGFVADMLRGMPAIHRYRRGKGMPAFSEVPTHTAAKFHYIKFCNLAKLHLS